jgi:putative pyruvate formate lyase activating enzyme
MKKYPSYLNLNEAQFKERINQAYSYLLSCRLCPHQCGVNRKIGQTGFCRSTIQVQISSYNAHFGEEPPISGIHGSGTIFFTNCTLCCVYCQNYPISQLGHGNPISVSDLSRIMLDLQKQKCHNINFVTPTHFVPQIIEAIELSRSSGLHIPLVYNTSGYESIETLQLLDGIIDIYLPDAKYGDNVISEKYSRAENYFSVMKESIKEMYRQVGDLKIDQNGTAVSGLLVRHLVLPHNLAGTDKVLKWIAEKISKETYISLMAQYFPAFQASKYPALSRRINQGEYRKAREAFKRHGLTNGWIQEYSDNE